MNHGVLKTASSHTSKGLKFNVFFNKWRGFRNIDISVLTDWLSYVGLRKAVMFQVCLVQTVRSPLTSLQSFSASYLIHPWFKF